MANRFVWEDGDVEVVQEDKTSKTSPVAHAYRAFADFLDDDFLVNDDGATSDLAGAITEPEEEEIKPEQTSRAKRKPRRKELEE